MPSSILAKLASLALGLHFAVSPSFGQDVYPGTESAPLTPADGERFVIAEASSLPPGEGPGYVDSKGGSKASVEIHPGNEVSAVPKRFQYAFRLNLRGVYDDNIFLTNTNRVDDFYFAIEPGLTLGYGDIVGRDANYIRFDYAPSIFLFADNSDADAIQHLFRLEGRYSFGHLGLSISQDVHLLEGANLGSTLSDTTSPVSGVNLDTGGDTEVNIFTTRANLTYDLTGKTFLSGGLFFTVYDYEDLISSDTISGNLFINYNYSPKLVVGFGGTAGYNWVDSDNPDQSFEQINIRTTYQISGKVSLNASVGVEFRQFEDNLRGEGYISPVYELGATYQPFPGTTLTARGSRRSLNSAVLQAQNYASTNITFGARQRLLRRIYLGLTAGYENSDYYNTVEFVNASRSDNYVFVQPAVDVTLTEFWTAGVYYLHRNNDSSFGSFSFNDNQVGLRTSLSY